MVVRIAVIGAGVMGTDHARIVAGEVPGAELQAVCDASEDRARAAADAFGAAHVETDPLVAIGRADVDAVIIASPDETHADLVLATLDAGKPALCEKPLAPSPGDCRRVLEAEAKSGRALVQLGYMRRFDPSYVEMKSALDAGTLGRALMMHNFHRNVASPGAWFTGDMAITNSAPHEFDAARFVLGSEITAIAAWQPDRSDEMTAPVVMVLETADAQIVTIEINNNAAYGYDVRGELVGETGSVSLNTPVHARYDLDLQSRAPYAPDWRPRFADAYRLQAKDWLRSIERGTPSPTAANSWDGYCAAVVADCGVRALREGRKVAVDPGEMPAFYRNTQTGD